MRAIHPPPQPGQLWRFDKHFWCILHVGFHPKSGQLVVHIERWWVDYDGGEPQAHQALEYQTLGEWRDTLLTAEAPLLWASQPPPGSVLQLDRDRTSLVMIAQDRDPRTLGGAALQAVQDATEVTQHSGGWLLQYATQDGANGAFRALERAGVASLHRP